MLNDLYQALILDHSKNPRNFGVINSSHKIEANNPLCGDHLTLYLDIKDNIIVDVSFEGNGCAISKASSSLMTEAIKGKGIEEVLDMVEKMKEMFKGKDIVKDVKYKKLLSLQGVSKYPSRIKCASLAWHAAKSIIKGENEATTE